jgi:hypothetical protein
VVAKLDAIDPRTIAVKARVSKRHLRALKRLAWPDHDAV